MKKQTAYDWIARQQQHVRKDKQEALRYTKQVALQHCHIWLALPWAQMRAPVQAKRAAHPLLERAKQSVLSAQETHDLEVLLAADSIYQEFERKITPTALQAEFAHRERQREQAARDHHHLETT